MAVLISRREQIRLRNVDKDGAHARRAAGRVAGDDRLGGEHIACVVVHNGNLRIGRRTLLMLVGTALLAPTYLMLGYGRQGLVLPVVLMGIAFALVPAVMWPAVMLIVPQGSLGKAFGLMSLIQSIGLMGFNTLIGWANDAARAGEANPAGYHLGMWLFTGSLLLGLLFAFLLRRQELGPDGHGLELASGRRRLSAPG